MRASVLQTAGITVFFAAFAACSPSRSHTGTPRVPAGAGEPGSVGPIASTGGFTAPEAVRYDPGLDMYFVSNWGSGQPSAKDNNGFISRLTPDGAVEQLRFIAGGASGATLHSPRGMTIVGDTLWVVDADAVRAFDRRNGSSLATVDFSAFRLGFLNDIAAGSDAMYVTDTGTDHIYRIAAGRVTIALQDSALGAPNGITWDVAGSRFIIVPYGGASAIRAWTPGSSTITEIGRSVGSKFDGVEILSGDRVLVASQGDSSIHLFSEGKGGAIIRTGGAPADIGVDTRRNRVAIPFVSRNLVEIWRLPAQ